MSKNKAYDIEKLDIKVESGFMLWLKRIAYVVTIITTLSGGVLGILSYIREVRDPRAQAGYDMHSQMLKENSENIRQNREEIRFIYRAMIKDKFLNNHKRVDGLKDTPIQKPLNWRKLPIDKGAGN